MFDPSPRMGKSCCTRKNGLRTFVAKRLSKSSTVCSLMVAALVIPALDTSTCKRSPTIERTCLARSVAPSGVPKSATCAAFYGWERKKRRKQLFVVDRSFHISAFCAAPNNWKHRGNVVRRRRQARKPKCRIRTKPFGSRCSRKRRKNWSCDKAVSFFRGSSHCPRLSRSRQCIHPGIAQSQRLARARYAE